MIIKFAGRCYMNSRTYIKIESILCRQLNINGKPYSVDSSSNFKLSDETIRQLEKLSLVNFENQKNVNIVESAIVFANGIDSVDTNDVEPLVTVLENRSLKLREDIVADGNLKKEVLRNATLVDEDFFVAPPGNIPVNLQNIKKS